VATLQFMVDESTGMAVVNYLRSLGYDVLADYSRKGAKDAKFGESGKIFFFAGLASWRENLG